MTKHTILFLVANPLGPIGWRSMTQPEIPEELDRSGHRDRLELVMRWAVRPLDLPRELRKFNPTVVHFSGHDELSELWRG